MRVDIIELLRCPAPHESSALVTVADARDGDQLLAGTLGCPVCLAEYVLRGGVVYLTSRHAHAEQGATSSTSPATDATRLAALLALEQPALRVVLCGTESMAADAITALVDANCLAINAPVHSHTIGNQLRMDAGARLPLADASMHALAIDAAHLPFLSDAARVIRSGGRVVAPAAAPLPPGLRELARDDHQWVAQVESPVSRPVTIARVIA